MAKRGRTKTWDTTDVVLQKLYRVSLFNPEAAAPVFGSGVTFPLSIGSFVTPPVKVRAALHDSTIDEPQMLPPTLYNLAWHFGYMQWAINNVAHLMRKSKGSVAGEDLDKRFFQSAMIYAKNEFESQRVGPLRKALLAQQLPLYLYCVPSVSVETEIVSGEPLTVEGDRVLCVLPKSVDVAKAYGLSESEIQLLAPQVIWVIKNLCSFHAIKTSQDLLASVNGWSNYLSPAIVAQIQGLIGQSNPHLLSEHLLTTLPQIASSMQESLWGPQQPGRGSVSAS